VIIYIELPCKKSEAILFVKECIGAVQHIPTAVIKKHDAAT
jgi:hypothetical protein